MFIELQGEGLKRPSPCYIKYITVENLGHQGRSPIQGLVFSALSVANICQNKGTQRTILKIKKHSGVTYCVPFLI